jgi:hypothetical protein
MRRSPIDAAIAARLDSAVTTERVSADERWVTKKRKKVDPCATNVPSQAPQKANGALRYAGGKR